MQKLIIRFSVALITFITGITIPPISNCPTPGESNQFVLRVDQMLVEAEPKQSPSVPQDPRAKGRADLSIVVEINQPDPYPPSFEGRRIKLAKNQPTLIDLDLAEGIDNQEVALNVPDNSVEYRMFQRYRTSMSISAEGPHLDLVNWRHFDSPWLHLHSLGPRRFRTLRGDQMESSKFPLTTNSEILQEVRRRVGNDWPYLLELVKTCRGPNDGACLVAISSLYLRIQKQVRGGWIDIGLVEFRLPMGC
jgi:hypothetical protein